MTDEPQDLKNCAECPHVIRFHNRSIPRRLVPVGRCGHEKVPRKIDDVTAGIPDWCPMLKGK